MYEEATSEPYSFLYINSVAKSLDEMFWLRFERPIIP